MNHIYKVIWNALLGLWVVASELAKGKVKAKRSLNRENQNNADKLAAPVQFRPHMLALCMVLSVSMPVAFANDNNKISDQNALINAVNAAASGAVITLTDNITITEQLNVDTLNKNVIIDGGGKFGLIVNNETANGFVINDGSGTFTLRNMTKIDSANYYGMVQINNGDINLVYDNIDYLGRSQLIFMGTYGQATNSVMTFGNIKNDVVVNDRDQEIGEVNKVAYTGRFHVTHTAGQYSFHNNNAQQNTATMDFGSEADVYIYRTNNQPNLTPQGNYAWQYTFADGAKFELISTQNVLSGTNNNRGMKIGTYDPNAGFGSGASIILTETSPGSGLLGNAIDNFTTNNTGYDIGQTGSADVIFNLGQYTHLATQATAVAATKTAGDAGIYIRNAGIIEAATGIDTIQNGSGKTLIVNQGTITSTKTGVSVSSSAASNITLDNTGGNINATGGTGINVSGEAKLNLLGGIINASQDADAITLSNNAAHTLSDVTLNLNGSGSAIVNSAISGTPNVTMANTTINMANGVALSDLRGLNFAASEKGQNTINVTGTGTGIATDSSSLSAFNPNALQINVKGAGVGIAASGGGADLSNATLNVNVTNNAGVALSIADGVTNNETTIGKQVNLDATDATAIQFTGDKGKIFINNGTVKGNVNFNGDAAHIITNNGTIAGALTAENGNTTLILGQGSQNLGNITLGNGNNNVTINNAANVTSVSAGSGDNKFTLNGLTGSDTSLGKIEVGSGNNQLDLVNAKNTLQDTTVLQGFTNISLTNNTDLTLVSKSNITGGDLLLDSSSTLEFDKRYQGEFSVNLMAGSGTDNIDGNIIVNDGANVTLANSKANTFSGGWTINNGGVVNATNSNQIDNSRVDLDGTLNLNGLQSFNNDLTGIGILNINSATKPFNFASSVGDQFQGTVALTNTAFTLDDNNTNALKAGTLALNKQSTTTVGDTDRSLNNLVVNGGTVQFNSDAMQSKANGIIKAETLTLQGGVIALEGSGSWENIPNPPAPDLSIFAQDKGDVLMTLITAGKVIGNVNDMTFELNDNQIPSPTSPVYEKIIQNNQDVANATYHYGLTDNKDNTRGLYVKYGLVGLELLTNNADALLLETQGNETLHTVLFGKGGLNIDAGQGSITLANGNNSYSGTTTLSTGTLLLGANKALGNTSNLNISKGAITSLNGFNQTLVTLTNNGTVDLAGGQLTLSEGGSSASVGGLTGKGQLIVNGKDLVLSAANNQLQADTLINSGASITLTESGNLGTSQVTVAKDGQLTLNSAGLVLNNILSGEGRVNTQANTTLGGNSTFTGSHTVGAGSALTISQANNLGADTATVALQGVNSALVLNKLAGAIKNSLTGMAESVVRLQAASQVALTGDNSGFGGSYSLSGGSTLTVSKASNLGTNATVSLQTQQDKLNLSGYQGALSNAVKGSGVMALINSTLTLNAEAPLIGNTVGVDIDGNSTLALSGISDFDHQLTGNGALNVSDSGAAFAFGQNAGAKFTGTVDVSNTGMELGGGNTSALTEANLTLSAKGSANVADGIQNIGKLTMNGGTVTFRHILDDHGQFISQGHIVANNIDVTGGGEVQVVLPSNITPSLEGKPLLSLDTGVDIASLMQGKVTGSVHELKLADGNGQLISAEVQSNLFNNGSMTAAATGLFDYGLTTGTQQDGLYVNYGLKEIDLQAKGTDALKLEPLAEHNGLVANNMSAWIRGNGDLAVVGASDNAILSLSNSRNDYSGATLVGKGGLWLKADHVLGNTSELRLSDGTTADIGGYQQTLGQLNTEVGSRFNLNGGTVYIKDGGQIDGALIGAGQLTVQSGQLNTSSANRDFTGATTIDSAAAAQLFDVTGLGSGAINNNGKLTLSGAQGSLSNNLSGQGGLLLEDKATVQLTGDNSHYTGTFFVKQGTALTASKAEQLGDGTLDNQGRVTLNIDKAWNMNNVISGSGDLIKQGTATLQIAKNTVTAANIIIENGLIQLGSGAISKMAGLTRGAETQSPAELKGNVSIQKNGALGGYGHVIGNVTNAGSLIMPHALTGDRYADFTIKGDYIGQKGSHIFFDTVLAGDDSSTDRLIITGDASGTSTLKISNIGGRGGDTRSGIKIIDIVGESKAKFQLEGRLVAGAYDYKLYQGTGETGPNDGNWYLRTLQPDRPEAGSYIANLAAANTLFNTSLENRSGDTWYTDALTGEKKATSMWLRSSGSHHRFRDNSESLKTQDNRFVVQLGGDVFRFSRNDSDLWRIGLMAGHANSHNSTTTRATGSNSKGTAKGYSVGTYGTWFANEDTENGAYVDTWLQYSWFKNEVNGQGLAQEKYNAKGFTTSLESGYTYQLSAGDQYNVYLQPKAQAIWMGVKADTHREVSDTVVSGKGNGNVQTRLGVKAFLALSETEKTAKSQTFKPYIETTWVHNTKDFAAEMTHETTGSYTFKQGGASNIGEVKLGLEGDITKRLNMWGNVTQQVGGHGYRDTGVTLGVKYNF